MLDKQPACCTVYASLSGRIHESASNGSIYAYESTNDATLCCMETRLFVLMLFCSRALGSRRHYQPSGSDVYMPGCYCILAATSATHHAPLTAVQVDASVVVLWASMDHSLQSHGALSPVSNTLPHKNQADTRA